ncbi:Sxm1p KNAG_0C04570 [Huiozyma naganishii CBS 8797]|uniref:Importin N-terminal domain-containing protein n=1 Tax=Huiozyma naganishii (strain ATCC MYA-139 / BCRC 22969 / CBS 8797 / KCTC 17520 / NBRC 10181 / NCYC 3082 / Yp74L-3) TaxID=1071383 RepID=J7S4Z0_HUIN7|nr:hypothetical protein KNAG_0C04570 [Kazachstania naganishii CBS 8797]CCK69559.1 hypothetical protein KNAG_0C04570 [Kazachstania naganishii CBS 8797]
MQNEQAILQCIEQTMVADAKIIRAAEMQLYEFQKVSGFASFLLKVVSNGELPLNIRMSAAIYLKNKVQKSWKSDTSKESVDVDDITLQEGSIIKENIIQILVANCENNHIRPHLTEAIRIILSRTNSWDMSGTINGLLTSGKADYTYTGLLLLFQMCNAHRYDMCGHREYIDSFISDVFPTVEEILSQLVNQTDYRSSELLYLILKSFKYACLNNFPQYFNNVEKLNSWIQLHLFICAKPLPKEVLDIDVSDRSLDKRVKVSKWGFGNLNRFIHRYTKSTKNISEEFVSYVFNQLAPTIVQEFFKIIQIWSTGSLWLSESALYHLIQFLEKCMVNDSLYPLIESHLSPIIESLIFTCLCASDQSVTLLEEDSEEYTRRYFDMNREGSTADVASTDFVFVVGHKRPEKLNFLLPFVNDILNSFVQNPNDLAIAYKQEGAMRMISSLFTFFSQDQNSLESLFSNYIVNLIGESRYPFLVARALETVANFSYEFKDLGTLSKIYELTYHNLLNSEELPVQIEAADALKTLVISNPQIHSHISGQVPGIMEKLLKLSKEFEIDILSEVMEAFVERFSDELTPFAKDLAHNLADQFIRLAQSMVESSASGSVSTGDQDQEIQASSLLQTMTTMVMSMNKVSLLDEFVPVCKFIIQSAQIVIITETVDLMDAMTLSSKSQFQQVAPQMWELFHDVLDSFQTYAMDYFECYNVFFESIVLFGFPQDQTYVAPFLQILSVKMESDIDYDVENVFELLQMYALSMKDIPLFTEAVRVGFGKAADLDVDAKSIIKLCLANLFVRPTETLQVLESQGATLEMLKIWYDNKFCSVYAVKLQIMAILSLLRLNEMPGSVSGFIGQFANKLVALVEQLPKAIRKRDVMASGGENLAGGDEDALEPEEEEDYFEDFEDDFKETPLDDLNAFDSVHLFFTTLQGENPEMYQQIVGQLTEDKRHSLQVILEFVSQKA